MTIASGPRSWSSRASARRRKAACAPHPDRDRPRRPRALRALGREAGLAVRMDGDRQHLRAARRHGPRRAPVVMGSHLDSSPRRQVRRRLRRHGRAGSRAHAERRRRRDARAARSRLLDQRGRLALRAHDDGLGRVRRRLRSSSLAQRDVDGISGGRGAYKRSAMRATRGAHRLGAYFEAHIEQGPVLEDTEARRSAWCRARSASAGSTSITGQDAHAGPTPMELRQDALLAAAELVLEVNRIAGAFPDYARGTVGLHAGEAELAQRGAGRSAHDGRLAQREGRRR
jgi:beta-ureidopropionase / N-carbamoyl-L-amino-acid hydrolase